MRRHLQPAILLDTVIENSSKGIDLVGFQRGYLFPLPFKPLITWYFIITAREIPGNYKCIMGDVPPAPLKLGEAEEVDGYCPRPMRETGAEGEFILSSGCSIPIDAEPENVKAMP
jgi:uroporphyrinogen-III decarboxylase